MGVTFGSRDTAFCNRSLFRPVIITRLLFSENSLAISKPMPALPPVISTVFCVVFIASLFSVFQHHAGSGSRCVILLRPNKRIPIGIFCVKKIRLSPQLFFSLISLPPTGRVTYPLPLISSPHPRLRRQSLALYTLHPRMAGILSYQSPF